MIWEIIQKCKEFITKEIIHYEKGVISLPTSGVRPGKGSYECSKCGTLVKVAEDEILPMCPICKGTNFTNSYLPDDE